MWSGSKPDAPNWQGSTDEAGLAQIYTTSPTDPAFLPNPKVGIIDSNVVDLPRRYNDFAVNNLTAEQINGNPNFDAENWWRYQAKGNVSAELLPPPIIPPTILTRQYDLTGWKDIKCTNLTCETDPLLGGVVTCRKAVAPEIVGTDADFSTSESGQADVNIYGANLVAGDNALYVEGGTTLTGGGIVHGVTIGALRAAGIDTVRIDVLPVGMSLESATFITANAIGSANMSAGGAASVAAGGALSLAGGSYIEYNSDQHYFINTSAGNDYTDAYIGNIHGADGGTASLRINEGRGVEIGNVKQMNMYSEIVQWDTTSSYTVDSVVYSQGNPYKVLIQNSGLSPLLTTIPSWVPNKQYYVNNIVDLTGVGRYSCLNNVSSSTSPNSDFTNWTALLITNLVSEVWQSNPTVPTYYVSTITGDTVSTLTNGVVNTRQINLATTPTYSNWSSTLLYLTSDIVHGPTFNYLALIDNINVPPNGTQAPTWVSGGTYVVNNFVSTGSLTFQCIADVSGSTVSPNADPTNWLDFPIGMSGIWQLFTPTPVVSTINGDENSVLTIGDINARNIVANTSIDTPTISTNSITPHSAGTVTINSGNLNLADNNITGVTTLTTRNLAAPSGVQIHLQSDLNGQSLDGSLRSMYNMSLIQTRSQTGADASVDFLYSDDTLAMEISVDEPANLAKIQTDVPLAITSNSGGVAITSTGTDLLDNIVLTSAKLVDLKAPTGSVRVQANNFTVLAEETVQIAAVNQEISLTSTNSEINLVSGANINLTPTGLIIANNDIQLVQTRWGIVDTPDYAFMRWWYEGFSYSFDAGATWIAVAADWWRFAAQGIVNFSGYGIENVGSINGHNLYSHGQFIMTTSQFPTTASTAEQVLFDTQTTGLNITFGTNLVKCTNAGTYQITMDACLEHAAGPAASIDVWLKLNGVNISNTTQHSKLSNAVSHNVLSATFLLYLADGDEVTAWFASDNTDVGFSYASASTTPYDVPERPSFSLSFLLVA